MKLTILGCYSATPRHDTNPTAQVLEVSGHIFLIDCGEGTQVQLRRKKVRFSRIKHIFISHLHGDHYYGLIGLIGTFHLLGREAPLHIYGPKGIKEVILLQLKLGKSYTSFPLFFHELEDDSPVVVFEDEKVTVTTIPLDHRIYANGFLFQQQPGLRKLNIDAVKEAHIDKAYFKKLQQGFDVENESGVLISNATVTYDPDAPLSYAFCSDTAYKPDLADQLQGVSVLYHEATFLEHHADLAHKTKHSTAIQAAQIAKKAKVGQLILGHYSTRYHDLDLFKTEAETVFQPVVLAEDGKEFEF